MNTKLLKYLPIFISLISTVAQSKEIKCWDRTFMYNQLSITENQNAQLNVNISSWTTGVSFIELAKQLQIKKIGSISLNIDSSNCFKTDSNSIMLTCLLKNQLIEIHPEKDESRTHILEAAELKLFKVTEILVINNKPKLTTGYKLRLAAKSHNIFENTELVSQEYYHQGAGGDETDNCSVLE